MSLFDRLQQTLTRRTAVKVGLGGTAGAVIGAKLHLAAQDVAAQDWRSFSAQEREDYFADPRNGESQLVDIPEDASPERIAGGWYLGVDGSLIEDESFRSSAASFDRARINAWKLRDWTWLEGNLHLRIYTGDGHLPEADAHSCYAVPGSPSFVNCHLHYKETRPSGSCSGGWACFGHYHCHTDGHTGDCRINCGPCSPWG
jgi:hypothetical protein